MATLTKEIDLNPVSDEDVRAYYADLSGRELSGENLLKALKPILKNGQQYFSYDSSNGQIWKMYEITDRDWELSPASEIKNGTYDEATNKIHNYTYGDNSNKRDNPYLHLLYRNHEEPESRIHAWDHHGDNNGIDREHIWPKSRGFGKDPDNGNKESTDPGARGDPHHLLPGDSYVNSSSHSNYSYGFVDMDKVSDNAGENYKINGKTVVNGNYRGTSLTFAKTLGNEEVFEPQDSDKGDIARACFYMVARYNNLAGDDDTIDGGNPNLFLEDTVDRTTIMSKADRPVSIGILRDLLAWHQLDPVDEYEKYRNDLVYRNYGKNRNPFIDFPTWVDAIWGTVELDHDGRTIKSRNASPVGVANPNFDPLYEADNYEIASYNVLPSVTTYFVGETFTFSGQVKAIDIDGIEHDITKRCSFSSFTCDSVGKKTVEVTHRGEVRASFEIDIVQPVSIEVKDPKTSFTVGDEFSFGGEVIGKAENGVRKDVTSNCEFSGYDMKQEGTQEVKIKHVPSGLEISYEITVNPRPKILGMDPMVFALVCVGVGVLVVLLFIIILYKANPKHGKKVVNKVKKHVKKQVKKQVKKKK